MTSEIILHEMGEGVLEGTVSRWLKAPGDAVDQYEAVLEIETDKVTTEVIAEAPGTLLEIRIAAGETVPVGTVLGLIGEPAAAVAETDTAAAADRVANNTPPAAREAVPAAPAGPGEPAAADSEKGDDGQAVVRATPRPYAGRISPVVGRIAAEHQVDLSYVRGTGRDGRITKKDILAHVAQQGSAAPDAPTPAPAVDPAGPAIATPAPAMASPAPAEGLEPHSSIRRAIAEHMVRSKRTSPHVTTVFEFDFAAVARHRARHKAQFAQEGLKLTYTAYLVAATAAALRQHPRVNSEWRDDGLILKSAIHIGMATAIDDGLIVPVIKDADRLSLRGLAHAVTDLAERARARQLKPAEVQGGTFSITNHGVSGSLFATPIINQPQCGILGVGQIEKRVRVIDDAIAIRPLAYVSFTFDHRILDGASADHFVATIKETIEGWS